MQFRKKPVVIEAMQVPSHGELPPEFVAFLGGVRNTDWRYENQKLRLFTREGVMACVSGDWVIKGVKGELYPCKPDIFAATYEAVAEPTAVATAPSLVASKSVIKDNTTITDNVGKGIATTTAQPVKTEAAKAEAK
jgi:hypothetical protein